MRIEFSELSTRIRAAITSLEAVANEGLSPKVALADVERLTDSTAHADLPAEVAEQINRALECMRPELNFAGAREHLQKAHTAAEQELSSGSPDADDDGVVHKR